jgi:hypothetical protein
MVFDIGCRSIQSIGGAGGQVVDGIGALAPRFANGGGSRMERARCFVSRLIQSPAGGPAQIFQ